MEWIVRIMVFIRGLFLTFSFFCFFFFFFFLLQGMGLGETKPTLPASERAFSWTPPQFSRMDSLFIIAATGEPRFKTMRDSCEKILVADSSTSTYLLTHRLVDQTPRQRHYVERLLTVIADSGRCSLPVKKLAQVLSQAPDSLKAQLLQIGSEVGDSTFLPIARLYLYADSEAIRKAAIRSLGLYPRVQPQGKVPHPDPDLDFLLKRVEQAQGLERQQILWALSRRGALKDWPLLLPLLKDTYHHNRQWARRIILQSCPKDWTQLAKYRPAKMEPQEVLEWTRMERALPGIP